MFGFPGPYGLTRATCRSTSTLKAISSPAANRLNFILVRETCTGRAPQRDVQAGRRRLARARFRPNRPHRRPATLETDDGELIYMTNTRRFVLSEAAIARLGAGERLGPDEIYAPPARCSRPAWSATRGERTHVLGGQRDRHRPRGLPDLRDAVSSARQRSIATRSVRSARSLAPRRLPPWARVCSM